VFKHDFPVLSTKVPLFYVHACMELVLMRRPSLLRLAEEFQIGCRLILTGRHEPAVGGLEVALPVNEDVLVVLGA
jgi:hypothetical protein